MAPQGRVAVHEAEPCPWSAKPLDKCWHGRLGFEHVLLFAIARYYASSPLVLYHDNDSAQAKQTTEPGIEKNNLTCGFAACGKDWMKLPCCALGFGR